mgnify:CR=1 FL=1
MAKPRNAFSGEGQEPLRAVFEEAATSMWGAELQRRGFELSAHQDEGLFTSFLHRCNTVLASISIDWREGDIEARVGVTGNDSADERAANIWDLPHHALLERYVEAVAPEKWEELKVRVVVNIQVPDEPLTSSHILQRVAFLAEAIECVLPEILRAPGSIVKLCKD